MSIISLIAAIDENNGLGANNQLLCHLPADIQYFKKMTLGKPIIMGSKTYASIGKPLPGRENIVLSRSSPPIKDVLVVHSLSKAIKLYENVEELMIIGGAEIYRLSMERASRLYITHIHHQFDADVFFPTIDLSLWNCVSKEFLPHDEKNKYDLTFCIYERM